MCAGRQTMLKGAPPVLSDHDNRNVAIATTGTSLSQLPERRYRNDRNVARMSSVRICGCSQAAK